MIAYIYQRSDIIIIVIFLLVLGIEHKASHMLSKCFIIVLKILFIKIIWLLVEYRPKSEIT